MGHQKSVYSNLLVLDTYDDFCIKLDDLERSRQELSKSSRIIQKLIIGVENEQIRSNTFFVTWENNDCLRDVRHVLSY